MRTLSLHFFFLLIYNVAFSQIPANADSIIKQNNIIKETIVSYRYKKKLSEDSLPLTIEMLYDNQGKMIAFKRVFKGVASFMQSFEYDEKNVLKKIFSYGDQNKILSTEIYEYDSSGKETGSHSFGYKGVNPPDDTIKTQGLVKKIYNGKNQLIELFYTFEADGILNKSDQYAYTDDGKIDKSFYFTQDGELNMSYNYMYKKNGDVTIFSRYKSGEFIKAVEKYYNRKKQLVKEISYYGKGIITNYLYNIDGTLSEKTQLYGEGFTIFEKHFYTTK